MVWRHCKGKVGLRHADRRKVTTDALQVALADQGGLIPGGAQDIDERRRGERQRNSILPCAVQRRHSSRHQRCAVRHANRRGDVKTLKASAGRGEPVDARRFNDLIAVTTEMVGTVLIGDDQKEIRSIVRGHQGCSFLSVLN